MTKKISLFFIIVSLILSCKTQNEIISSTEMISQPQVKISDKYVVLKASTSGRNSATVIYKIKHKMFYKKSIIEFYGLEGIKLIGASKDTTIINIRKFKNIKPENFTYFYVNPDGTKIKINPIK